jgi:hypothetical protein
MIHSACKIDTQEKANEKKCDYTHSDNGFLLVVSSVYEMESPIHLQQ